jgi:hypothetical protein
MRERQGREARPTLGIVDSQTVQAMAPKARHRVLQRIVRRSLPHHVPALPLPAPSTEQAIEHPQGGQRQEQREGPLQPERRDAVRKAPPQGVATIEVGPISAKPTRLT